MRSVALYLFISPWLAVVASSQALPPKRNPEITNGQCDLIKAALQIDDLDEARSLASNFVLFVGDRYPRIRMPPSLPPPPTPGSDIHQVAAASCADVRADLAADDPSKAYVAAMRLHTELERLVAPLPASPRAKFDRMEKAVSQLHGLPRFYRLVNLAIAAFDAGDYRKATAYANELLKTAPQYPNNWNHGNAIYFGNWMLGRVVLYGPRHPLRRTWSHFLDWDLDRPSPPQRAGVYLLRAAATHGSPQLNFYGPNTTLAKELLEKGEREVVLQYFELCAKFWQTDYGKLAEWTAAVKRGDVPNFGANLRY